jgi:DNA polymerase V
MSGAACLRNRIGGGRALTLTDGNSFYCACDRVFDAKLARVPVIALSNNDGFSNQAFTVKRLVCAPPMPECEPHSRSIIGGIVHNVEPDGFSCTGKNRLHKGQDIPAS